MVKHIEDLFPKLRGKAYQVTSPRNEAYNCIAWAAGDTTDWWWPDFRLLYVSASLRLVPWQQALTSG